MILPDRTGGIFLVPAKDAAVQVAQGSRLLLFSGLNQ